jgi:hypothetical protein
VSQPNAISTGKSSCSYRSFQTTLRAWQRNSPKTGLFPLESVTAEGMGGFVRSSTTHWRFRVNPESFLTKTAFMRTNPSWGGMNSCIYGGHTRSAKFSVLSSQGFAANMTGWSIQRQAMMHDCVFVAVFHSSHLFIAQSHGQESLFDRSSIERDVPTLAKLFRRSHRSREKSGNLRVLLLVKHGHLCPTSPTPQFCHAPIV